MYILYICVWYFLFIVCNFDFFYSLIVIYFVYFFIFAYHFIFLDICVNMNIFMCICVCHYGFIMFLFLFFRILWNCEYFGMSWFCIICQQTNIPKTICWFFFSVIFFIVAAKAFIFSIGFGILFIANNVIFMLLLSSGIDKHICILLSPRSQVFNEVAEVLEMVDSKGAGEIVWLRYCEIVNLR